MNVRKGTSAHSFVTRARESGAQLRRALGIFCITPHYTLLTSMRLCLPLALDHHGGVQFERTRLYRPRWLGDWRWRHTEYV